MWGFFALLKAPVRVNSVSILIFEPSFDEIELFEGFRESITPCGEPLYWRMRREPEFSKK